MFYFFFERVDVGDYDRLIELYTFRIYVSLLHMFLIHVI